MNKLVKKEAMIFVCHQKSDKKVPTSATRISETYRSRTIPIEVDETNPVIDIVLQTVCDIIFHAEG